MFLSREYSVCLGTAEGLKQLPETRVSRGKAYNCNTKPAVDQEAMVKGNRAFT